MDWRGIAFDWNRARSFLVAVEEGSYSAAARALGVSQPTIGRQIGELEQELEVALFERAGRGLVLTPQGRQLVRHVKAMADAAGQLSLASSRHTQSLSGTVRVSVSEVVGALVLPEIVKELHVSEPGIELEIVATVEESDLLRREADIAVRLYRPEQADLIAKKVGNTAFYPYATPDYIKRSRLDRPDSRLSDAEFIGSEDNSILTGVLKEKGHTVTSKNFPVRTNSRLAQWELAKSGIGIGIMSREVGDNEPAVVRVSPGFSPVNVEMWLVVHRELRTNLRIKYVFDFLHHQLGRVLGRASSGH